MNFLKSLFIGISFLGGAIMAEEIKVILELENESIEIALEDNVASREFVAQLPLELEFSDYVGKEKVATLPKALSVKNTAGYDPQIGDFFYFSPWSGIGIYYAKQPPYNGLVYLGKVLDSKSGKNGVEIIKSIKKDFKVKIR